MLLIDNQYIAAHQIARVGIHPAGHCICVTLVGGTELRQNIYRDQAAHQVLDDLVKRIDAEMRLYGPQGTKDG